MKLFAMSLIMSVHVSVFAFGQKITLNSNNASLISILKEVRKQSGFNFLYDAGALMDAPKVSVKVKEAGIRDVLDLCFKELPLGYVIRGRNVIISRRYIPILETPAPERVITGRVTNELGEPVEGVTVTVKGTSTATMTDAAGNYRLDVGEGKTLVFTAQGFEAQEIAIGSSESISISLKKHVSGLDEIVVVGYGTQKKSDLTGSVVRVDMTQKDKVPNTNLTQALSGYVPGVNASSAAAPGETGELTIRGRTTLSASQSPLIVVDGIIYNGPLSNINPNDIATIDVLKDASAAAVYGARASNGVLLVTTKRGRSDKPVFEINTYHGIQDINNTPRIKVMDADQFAISRVDHSYTQALRAWYATNPTDATGRPVRPDITDRQLVSTYLRSQEEAQNYLDGKYTNWVDEVLQTAPIHNVDVSIAGRTGKTNYFLSASHTDQKGVLLNHHFKRQTLRANFDNDIKDWFNLRLNTAYTFRDNSGIPADLNRGLLGSPLANIYTENGNFTNNLAGDPYVRNPLEDIRVDNVNNSHNLNVQLATRIEIPFIKGLVYDFNYSQNLYFNKINTYYPSTHTIGMAEGGLARKDANDSRDWLLNHILTYNKDLGAKHRINATFVYTAERRKGEGSFIEARGFANELLGYHSVESGRNRDVTSFAWEESNEAFMGRLNYSFDSRYLFTATMRRDGYSGFGVNNKWANFPSVGIGWVASQESFLRNVSWLNYLKVRASYGLNGNQGIGAYASLPTMGNNAYVFGGTSVIGVFPNAMGNTNLRWESTTKLNFGLDFTVLDQRLTGAIDFYHGNSTDVLVRRTLPQSTGYTQIWDNVSRLQNRGVEFSLSSVNINKSDFTWNTRVIFSLNRNKILELYEGVTQDLGNRWFVGEPIAAFFDYKIEGVWQEADLFAGNIIGGRRPGDYKLLDLNNDKAITNADRHIIGYPDPRFRVGLSNDFSYKNFTLSIFFNSIQGGNRYYIDNAGEDASRAGGADRALRTNRTALFDYWLPSRPVNDQPAMFYSYEGLHGTYFSRAFVRLQDVSLAYNFNSGFLSRARISHMQLYASGKNLYTWTDWPSFDPEVYNTVPMMRTVVVGLKVTF